MPSNATETIDVRILRLIGLEDVFDLDYDTYLTLLKEAMVKGRMPKTSIPSEEVELLTDEWKRVKSKKDKGRFKVKKKKITSTTLKTGGILTGKKTSIPTSKLLSAAQAGGGAGFDIGESFAKIAESVTSIGNTLKEKNKLSKKDSEFDRRAAETEKRKLQKENLKKRFAKMAGLAQKVMQPVQSLLDKIINYFVMIFLGNVVLKLVKWFSDEKNREKVKSFVRFIGDWWPALLGGWLLFGTSLGGLIRSMVPMIAGWTLRLGKIIASNPWMLKGAAAAALFSAGAFIPQLFPETVDEQERKTEKNIEEQGKDKVRASLEQKANNPNFWQRLTGESAEAKEQLHKLDTGETKSYGFVSGEKGVDKVDAKLTDGEFVMSTGAVNRYGVDQLEAMNVAGGGTNRPTIRNEKVFAYGGGLIGGKEQKKSGNHIAILTKNERPQLNMLGGGLSIQSPKVNIGDVNVNKNQKPQGLMRWLAGAVDYLTGDVTDFDKRGSLIDGTKRLITSLFDKGEKPKPTLSKIIGKLNAGPRRNKDGSISTRIGRNEMGDTPMEQWTKNFPHLASKLDNSGKQTNSTFNMGWNSENNSINYSDDRSQNLYSFNTPNTYKRPISSPPLPPFMPPESEPTIISSGSDNNINIETSATPSIPSISFTGPWYDKAAALGSPLS